MEAIGTVRPVPPRALRAVPPIVADTFLAIGVFAVFVIELVARDDISPEDRPWTAFALLGAESAILIARRRHPLVVWVLSGVIVSTYGLGPWPDPSVHYGVMASIYTVAVYTSARTSRRAAVITAVSMAIVLLIDPEDNKVTLAWKE